jgi:Tol biopolymer transport system component
MNRLILLAAMATACTVVTRPSIDDPPPETDGGRRDAGTKFDAGEVDAGDLDAGEPDAGDADAGSPKSARTWGEPILMGGVNSSASDRSPTVSEDQLRLCFSSDRDTSPLNDNIYCATRASTDQTFGAPVAQVGINSDGEDRLPVIWKDELYFASKRSGSADYDVYQARWNALAGTYGQPAPVAELNSANVDAPSSISADGLTMYLMSDRSGTAGGPDIWVATRVSVSSPWRIPVNESSVNSAKYAETQFVPAPDLSFSLLVIVRAVPGRSETVALWQAEADTSGGWHAPLVPADIRRPEGLALSNSVFLPDGSLIATGSLNGGNNDLYYVPTREPDPPSPYQFGRPEPLTSVNTGADEKVPSMTADGLKICFTSDRPGGAGDADIWCATRSSATDPFGPAVNMSAINSLHWDGHPALSQDGAELFFTSSRSGGGDIFRAVWVPAEERYKFPEAVSAVNSSLQESDAALTSNELTLVFARATNGASGWDLYLATRPDRSSSFGTPVPLTALNTSFLDSDPGPSVDGYRMIFCSQRPAAWETGSQSRRLWGSDLLGNGQWSSPALVEFEGFPNAELFGPALLADGSLLFHAWNWEDGNMDLYLAPPK